jgi:hypothetical protein
MILLRNDIRKLTEDFLYEKYGYRNYLMIQVHELRYMYKDRPDYYVWFTPKEFYNVNIYKEFNKFLKENLPTLYDSKIQIEPNYHYKRIFISEISLIEYRRRRLDKLIGNESEVSKVKRFINKLFGKFNF